MKHCIPKGITSKLVYRLGTICLEICKVCDFGTYFINFILIFGYKRPWVNPSTTSHIQDLHSGRFFFLFLFPFLLFFLSSALLSNLYITYMSQYTATRRRPGWGWEKWRPSSKRNCSTATGSLAAVREPLVWWPVPTQIMTCSRWPADLAVLLKMLSSCWRTWIASATWRPWRSIRRSCARASRADGFLKRNIHGVLFFSILQQTINRYS